MTNNLPSSNHQSVWEKAKTELRAAVDEEIFGAWFENLKFSRGDDKSIHLECGAEFDAIWIKDNYIDLLREQVSMAAGRNVNVEINFSKQEESAKAAPLSETARANETHSASRFSDAPQSKFTLPASINPRNTFENFVVGEGNKFAHATALAVAQMVGVAFNPLFMYGATGLGKTHLMHAIAQFVLRNNPRSKVVYVTSENFVNEYVDALREGNLMNFRRRHRNTDVLLIDDVQFFAGKERCQDEFFHTFNELFNSQKQIVLSCDKPLNEVRDIESRLISRFSWGVSVDIQAPDYETRLAILQKKVCASPRAELISSEVIELLARRFTRNIRRMEGALNKLITYASLIDSNVPVSLDRVQMLLADDFVLEDGSQQIDISRIQQKVAEYYKIDPSEITGRRRPASIAMARQVAMYLSRKLTTHSLVEIGKMFGNRDHGTVMHAIRVVDHAISVDENMRRAVEHLSRSLGSDLANAFGAGRR